MKTINRWAAAGALVALALAIAACGDDGPKTVTAVDYRFENLPSAVKAGTTLTLRNSSPKELHEMVLLRLPDQERRPVSELVKLPESELQNLFSAEPAMVLLRAPNNGQLIKAAGDGKVTQKGRYAVICGIPTGADPAAYLQAAQTSQGGPPNVPGGPPHFVQGMYGQITVK